MSVAAFTITLQKGITGGFAPPTPNALYRLVKEAESSTITVVSQVRPLGTPSLQDAVIKSISLDDHSAEIEELQGILTAIPPQYPGAADLYGLDISIIYDTKEFVASGASQYGSAAGLGVAPPTEEEKAKFQRAIDIIKGLAA
ncbi:hypothetical protein HYDPIDRAFT_170550 [Hydnomerulius pinastri MD-312]|uniref:Uncharacterized protein n=1 Tax=Hydnomerulius pinastri MD-312 TaxID=994086 RepID=A0A0C9VQ65_9AGAM|nr:hypothetical protein HYDPIDRAFT_170550 [Hydnomerulius pinastri MD-312]